MKKILVLICAILCLCLLAACNEVPQVESYKLNENGNLIATFDDGTTQDLGNFENDAINVIDTIAISDDGYYVLNGVKTNIVATEVFEVSFDTGYSATLPKKNVKDGYKVELPDLTRTGYALDGWYCNGEKWYFNDNVVKNDMTLTAVWIANSYSIAFDSNGGSSVENLTIKMDEQLTLPTPTYPLYTFDGWYSGNTKIESGKFTLATDLELTAKWHRTQYNIAFNTDGGNAITTIKVDSFSQVDTLPTPERNEYEFLGWYLGDTKIGLPYAFTEGDITLKALWRGVTQDYDFTEDDAGTGVKITKYKGNKTEVVIPTTLGGKPVTTIATDCFKDNDTIISIKFHSGVLNFAFKCINGCDALETIYVCAESDAQLTYIFGNMESIPASLKNIRFSEGSINVTDAIFSGFSILDEPHRTFNVWTNSDLEILKEGAFEGCSAVSHLYLNDGLTTIERNALYSTYYLECINIPATVTTIGYGNFTYTRLKYIVIPDSVINLNASFSGSSLIKLATCDVKPTSWSTDASFYYGFQELKETDDFLYALCKVGSKTSAIIIQRYNSEVAYPEYLDGYPVVDTNNNYTQSK